ncbi:hypothetical protein XF30_21070 [Bradyrhizobium sp. SUTN9-2]|nr:hypothetical protein XF30_21070 [Bradyrhizobium sp. SUTN9-2]
MAHAQGLAPAPGADPNLILDISRLKLQIATAPTTSQLGIAGYEALTNEFRRKLEEAEQKYRGTAYEPIVQQDKKWAQSTYMVTVSREHIPSEKISQIPPSDVQGKTFSFQAVGEAVLQSKAARVLNALGQEVKPSMAEIAMAGSRVIV